MIARLALPVAGAAVVGLLIWALLLRGDLSRAQADLQALQRSNAALVKQFEQSRLARAVEAARAERFAARAAELQSTLDAIDGVPDAPLHPDLIDLFSPRRR